MGKDAYPTNLATQIHSLKSTYEARCGASASEIQELLW